MEGATNAQRAPTLESMGWSSVPTDILLSIFAKINAFDILMGAGLACRSWLHAAKIPELWRSVNMSFYFNKLVGKKRDDVLCAMAREAIDRSHGHLEVFVGSGFVHNDLLAYLGERTPSLKSLRLIACYYVSNKGIMETINKFPLLEELELSRCLIKCYKEVFETIGESCPLLKHFKHDGHGLYTYGDRLDDRAMVGEESLGIASMIELRLLQIGGNDMTNKGLVAILDNCPHLEFLDICHCVNIKIDDSLRAKLVCISKLRLPGHED